MVYFGLLILSLFSLLKLFVECFLTLINLSLRCSPSTSFNTFSVKLAEYLNEQVTELDEFL